MLHDPRYEQKIKARIILNAAADYIEEHGWCQYALVMSGRVCMLGAVNAAICGDPAGGGDMLPFEVTDMLHRATGSASLSSWNDARERTKEQVVRALREAAQAG